MATVLPHALPAPAAPAHAGTAAAAHPIVRLSAFFFVGYLALTLVEYGALAIYLPFLKAARVSTLISYALLLTVLIKYKGEVMASRQAKLFFTFVVFTAAGILWAVVRSYVPLAVRFHFDYFGLFVITAFIVDSRHRADALAIVFVGITVLLVAQNRNMLGQDIRIGSFAAAYFMGDGNDFGWGLIVMLPFSMYLMTGKRRFLTRMIGLGGFLVGVVGIIGTESRGATLALIAGLLLYWATVAKRKALFAGVAVAGVMAVALLAPPSYFSRMNSLQHYDQDDSAMGRLRAWKAARQMALDYPLGVGANNFNSAYGRFYIPKDTSGWAAYRWMSTHSCYFKVLAEYGYPGLILFLTILGSTAAMNVRSARSLKLARGPTAFDPEWPLLLNVGLIGYAVCGLFLGGIIYPHLYVIAGLSVAASRMSQPELLVEGTAPPPAAAPAPVAPAILPRQAARPAGPRPQATGPGRFF